MSQADKIYNDKPLGSEIRAGHEAVSAGCLAGAGFVNIEFHNVCSVARLCGICSHSHGEQ